MQAQQHTQELLNKINRLPPEKVAVVEDFVEFLGYREDNRDGKYIPSPLF